ncbi:MAG: SRPBCC domain-containing protein [Alphaproteobacteria bacterium]|nr:SRPBCC domain-containing protein [Alphaproteobacteria bacterium]
MSAVIVSLRVKATPQEAFDVFTQEIAAWWKPNGLFQITPRGDGVLRFEPGEDGKLLTDLPSGKSFEIGRITAWAPGERLAFTWRQGTFATDQTTYVEVRFEALGDETRVTVEHRGWDRIPQEHLARHGFPLGVFQIRQAEHWRALLGALGAQIDERRI